MAMKTVSFEIKVALLGYVSAGKSTVLNALLHGKFSEVAKRRTTAGINFFRIVSKGESTASKGESSEPQNTAEAPCGEWQIEPEKIYEAEEAFKTIKVNNGKLRESNRIEESTFDVVLDEPLCEMHKDTNLVLIDIPGINEAGNHNLYREYVHEKWKSFDCVIAVMDVNQGVNTEEQVELLRFIQKNAHEQKGVPVIVLCNKVDDLEDEEVMELVDEVRSKVEEIFQAPKSCGTQGKPLISTQWIVSTTTNAFDCMMISLPCKVAFLPISAGNAFVYRTASRLSFDEFKKLDKSLIEKLGRDEVGKAKWRKLSQELKYKEAYDIVSCKSTYEGSLEATNFHVFLDALNQCVGGPRIQSALLKKQIESTLEALSFDVMFAQELQKINAKNKCLGSPNLPYQEYFWKAYAKCSTEKIADLRRDVSDHGLQQVMSQLAEYHGFVKQTGGNEAELKKIVEAMAKLVQVHIGVLVDNASNLEGWTKEGSIIDMPLYDWDEAMGLWRLDSVGCTKCSDGTNCQDEVHFHLCNQPGTWEQYSNGWRNKETGQVSIGKKFDSKQKPPGDCPHHWKHGRDGWRNVYTGKRSALKDNPVTGKVSWDKLSPRDYNTMCASMLLLSYSKTFCEFFGVEKIALEGIVSEYHCLVQNLNTKYASVLHSCFCASTRNVHMMMASLFLNIQTSLIWSRRFKCLDAFQIRTTGAI
jgi:small GTP-binding protein